MTKQEFLEELRQALSGEVSAEMVMDSYRYYSTYIDEEIRNGKKEEQVMEELGKPFLIARSIIAAQKGARVADEEYTEDGKTRRIRKEPAWKENRKEKKEKKPFVFDFGSWYAKVIYVLIAVLLIVIVFQIVKIGVWVLITFGIPVLIILGIIYLIRYFIR